MLEYRIDSREVREKASGQWDMVLEKLLNGIDGRAFQRGRSRSIPYARVACPVHGGASGEAFRFFDTMPENGACICNTCGTFQGFDTIMFVNGWDFPDTVQAVAQVLGLTDRGVDPRAVEKYRQEAERRRRLLEQEQAKHDEEDRRKLNKTWLEALPLDAPEAMPLVRFYAKRGLTIEPLIGLPNFRFHPALPFWKEIKGGKEVRYEHMGDFACLLGGITDPGGKPVNIHRTYFTQDGDKVDAGSSRKLMAKPSYLDMNGGCLRVGSFSGRVFSVTEGLENFMAVKSVLEPQVGRIPGASCVNAGMLETFVPPDDTEVLVIWGDKDRSNRGFEAARTLKARMWEERQLPTQILMPGLHIPDGAKGVDWNDVLLRQGAAGFPLPSVFQSLGSGSVNQLETVGAGRHSEGAGVLKADPRYRLGRMG